MPEAGREAMRQAVKRPEAALIVRLLHQTSGRVLTLANIHVAWMDLKAPALQSLQVMTTMTTTMTMTLTVTMTLTGVWDLDGSGSPSLTNSTGNDDNDNDNDIDNDTDTDRCM